MTEIVERGEIKEERRLTRDEAIGVVGAIIHAHRENSPHDLAVIIVNRLGRNWLISRNWSITV